MKPGSKPKPTQLKKLEGNPGKRPLPKNEPQPTPIMPVCPEWFDDIAKQEWERVAPELYKLGILTIVDHAVLEGYCVSYSMFVRAATEIGEEFIYSYIDTKAFKMKRVKKPEVSIVRDSLNQIRLLCAEFGLTPSSRGRMALPGGKDRDPFDELLDFCNKSAKKDV